MLKIAVISILLLIAFLYSRKGRALHESVRKKRRQILDRLSGFNRD